MTAVLPGSITGLDLHWKADSIVSTDGTAISSWAASVGSPALAQATGTKQPLYRRSVAALNGMPALDFDGVDDGLAATITNDNQPNTWFLVVDDDLATGNAELLQCSEEIGYFNSNNRLAAWAGGTNLENTTTLRYIGRRLIVIAFNGASSVIYSGDGTTGTAETSTSGTSLGTNGSGTSLNVGFHASAAWPPFNGRVAELGRYNVALSATNAQNLYEGLGVKYGTIGQRRYQRPALEASRRVAFY